MATDVAFPNIPRARRAAVRHRCSRLLSFPSIIRGARAARATGLALSLNTTSRSLSPIRTARSPAGQSIHGQSPAMRGGAGCCERRLVPEALRSTRRGATSPDASDTSCSTTTAVATSAFSPSWGGSRLKPESLAVRVAAKTIAEVAALTVADLAVWLEQLTLPAFQQRIADHIVGELRARVGFVNDVGLGYLTLDRLTRTLSGGEAQRIALSNALGSHLVDTLYVLDEPSIGLHPADVDRLLGLLRKLADSGNTVVVVEHDPAAMRAASWMVELGPASGEAGGQLVYQGPAAAVREAGTLTGQYLAGEKRIGVPSARRPAVRWLEIKGARLHNLAGVDVRIPLGTLTAVTGVSGSGKSTLVHDVLYRQLESRLRGEHTAKRHLGEAVGMISELKGWEALEDVVCIDQAPIGRTPRSNPVTYVKAFDELRALFANEALARARGYAPSTFSFNVAGGRCEACEGAGHVIIEMVFLANVFVPCEVCGGSRFKREVLDVKMKGVNIAQALEWTVDQAIQKLHRHPRLARCLWYLQQVGLGYLRLGQSATTLSGGEAQRLKIARELAHAGNTRRSAGKRKLYLL